MCDSSAGYCVECVADADCGADEACSAGRCTFYCRRDAACESDEYCVTETGACAPRECESTRDCEGGFRCERFVCVPIDDLVCEAGTETCSGGATSVLRCNADGTMESTESCASGSRCVATGSRAECRPVVCTAGELGCTDARTAFECDATGTVRTETPCASGQYCASGACTNRVCEPGSVRCTAEGLREVCDALGAAYEAMPCGPAQSCSGGVCRDRVCSPGMARCVSGSLTGREVCTADGLAWSSMPCADTQSCSAGSCESRICAPGVPECVGSGGTRECLASGLGYTSTTSCPSGQSCTPTTGRCGAWICTPGSSSCLSAGTRRVCNADGQGFTDTACASSTTCSAGLCAPWVCTPGAFSCLDTNTRRVCNDDGLGYTPVGCVGGATFGYACTGSGTCTERVCTPGSASAVCASTTARQVCNTDGLGFSASACASGQSCQTGVCAVRCGDGIVGAGEQCDDGNMTSGDGCSATCEVERCHSMDFTVGGYAQVARAPELDMGTSWSVSFWARARVAGASGSVWQDGYEGVSCPSYAVAWSGLGVGSGLRELSYYANSGGGSTNCGGTRLLTPGSPGASSSGAVLTGYTLPAGVWTHIAVVVSGTSGRTYANGALVHSVTVASVNPYTPAYDFRVGNYLSTVARSSFDGYLADVAVWRRALTDSEVSTLATGRAGALRVDPALAVWLEANEGSGMVVSDISGQGNSASLAGGARWAPSCPPR